MFSNKYYKYKIFLIIILFFSFLIYGHVVKASFDDSESNLRNFLVYGGYSGVLDNPILVIPLLVQGFLTLLGVIFLVITIYAGVRWMTAGGNEEQVTEAKQLLKNAIIGIAIIFLAYIITYVITSWISIATEFESGYDTRLPADTS